jgi:hypothetical protein
MSVPPEVDSNGIRAPNARCAQRNMGVVRTAPVTASTLSASKDPSFTMGGDEHT